MLYCCFSGPSHCLAHVSLWVGHPNRNRLGTLEHQLLLGGGAECRHQVVAKMVQVAGRATILALTLLEPRFEGKRERSADDLPAVQVKPTLSKLVGQVYELERRTRGTLESVDGDSPKGLQFSYLGGHSSSSSCSILDSNSSAAVQLVTLGLVRNNPQTEHCCVVCR
jgi:hypothetical protein